MKIMVDFIPNHSSSLHPWFLASSNTSHPDHSKYRDYYVWVGGSENDPPNTWVRRIGLRVKIAKITRRFTLRRGYEVVKVVSVLLR